jgi:trehalose synthase
VVQVSRWDPLKDMSGVLEAFRRIADHPTARLSLVGPDTHGVTDDPTAAVYFARGLAHCPRLPGAIRRRVQLVRLPMENAEENATMVNALQRHASIVVQKSLVEGFGLTATEAMWKHKAVVASKVGGLADQIDAQTGVLVDPRDLDACATALVALLDDPAQRNALGNRAAARVHEWFLPDLHLRQWAMLLESQLPAVQRGMFECPMQLAMLHMVTPRREASPPSRIRPDGQRKH